MKRQSRLENFMSMAEAVAQRSHDSETKVGSILVRAANNTLVSTGYNGFIPGAPDHALPTTRPGKYEYVQHSELNLIANCAKNGISTEGCYVVCTLSPCVNCTRLLVSSGIRKVIAKELYRDFNQVMFMKDLMVTYRQDEYGYYHISYDSVFGFEPVAE